MSSATQILEALRRIENIQAGLRQALDRSDHARKLEIVNLRRLLAIELGTLSKLASAFSPFQANEELAREYRARFSAMRAALALHQSLWPAVALDSTTSQYDASVDAVRSKSSEFIAWARSVLAGHE